MSRVAYTISFALAIIASLIYLKLFAMGKGQVPLILIADAIGASIGIMIGASARRMWLLDESLWPLAAWSVVVIWISEAAMTKPFLFPLIWVLYGLCYYYVVTLED